MTLKQMIEDTALHWLDWMKSMHSAMSIAFNCSSSIVWRQKCKSKNRKIRVISRHGKLWVAMAMQRQAISSIHSRLMAAQSDCARRLCGALLSGRPEILSLEAPVMATRTSDWQQGQSERQPWILQPLRSSYVASQANYGTHLSVSNWSSELRPSKLKFKRTLDNIHSNQTSILAYLQVQERASVHCPGKSIKLLALSVAGKVQTVAVKSTA